MLGDQDWRVRQSTAEAIAELANMVNFKPGIRIAGPDVYEDIEDSLRKMIDSDIVAVLLTRLSDQDQHVRRSNVNVF